MDVSLCLSRTFEKCLHVLDHHPDHLQVEVYDGAVKREVNDVLLGKL